MPGGAGKKEKPGMLNQQTLYALGVMIISIICFSALLRANKKAAPVQPKIDPADLEFNANAKQSCVCHSTEMPDTVAECAENSKRPWCFVNKTCPGSLPRLGSPGLHWKYCDVGEKVALPLLLPSIAQEIADALSKKPLTVAKRNELAMERARTFKHEDDIDLMVLLKRSIMTALTNCEMTILRGLSNDEHAKAYRALLDQQLESINDADTSLLIKQKLFDAAHVELASSRSIGPRMTMVKDYNKKAKKTIVIGKLMTTPLEKTDADTIMLAAEWDGLSPTQIKAYLHYCFYREMVVALEIQGHVKRNRSKRSRSSEDDDFFITAILLTVGVIVLYFGGGKVLSLYKDWSKKSQASKKRRDAAKKAAIDDTEIQLPEKLLPRQSSQTEKPQASDLVVAAAIQGTRKKVARRTKRAMSATSAAEKPSEPLDPNVQVEDWDESTETWIMRTRAEKAKEDVKRALLRSQEKDVPKVIISKAGKHKQSQDRKSKDTPSKDKRKLKQGGDDTAAKPAPTKTVAKIAALAPDKSAANKPVEASKPASELCGGPDTVPSPAARSCEVDPPTRVAGESDSRTLTAVTATKPTSTTLSDVPTGSGSSKAVSAPMTSSQPAVTPPRAAGKIKATITSLPATKVGAAGTGAVVTAPSVGKANPPSSSRDKASKRKEKDAANHSEERPPQQDSAVQAQAPSEQIQNRPTKGAASAVEATKGSKKSRRNKGKGSIGTPNLEASSVSTPVAAKPPSALPMPAPATMANNGTSPKKSGGIQKKAKEAQVAAAQKDKVSRKPAAPAAQAVASTVQEPPVPKPATAYVNPKAREIAAMLAAVAPATVKKPATTLAQLPAQTVANQPQLATTPPAGQPMATTLPPVVAGHAAVAAVAAAPHTVPNPGLMQTPVQGYALPGAYGGMVVGADGIVGGPGVVPAGMQMYDPNMVYVNQMAAPMMQGSDIQYVPNSEGHLVPAMTNHCPVYTQPMQYIMNPQTGEAVPMQYEQMMQMQVQPAYNMPEGPMSPVYVSPQGVPMQMQYMPQEYLYQQPQPHMQQQHPVRGAQRQPQQQALRAKKGGAKATSTARPKTESKR